MMIIFLNAQGILWDGRRRAKGSTRTGRVSVGKGQCNNLVHFLLIKLKKYDDNDDGEIMSCIEDVKGTG